MLAALSAGGSAARLTLASFSKSRLLCANRRVRYGSVLKTNSFRQTRGGSPCRIAKIMFAGEKGRCSNQFISGLGLFFEPAAYYADASSNNGYLALKQSPNLR